MADSTRCRPQKESTPLKTTTEGAPPRREGSAWHRIQQQADDKDKSLRSHNLLEHGWAYAPFFPETRIAANQTLSILHTSRVEELVTP
jgi:hypothetical protein